MLRGLRAKRFWAKKKTELEKSPLPAYSVLKRPKKLHDLAIRSTESSIPPPVNHIKLPPPPPWVELVQNQRSGLGTRISVDSDYYRSITGSFLGYAVSTSARAQGWGLQDSTMGHSQALSPSTSHEVAALADPYTSDASREDLMLTEQACSDQSRPYHVVLSDWAAGEPRRGFSGERNLQRMETIKSESFFTQELNGAESTAPIASTGFSTGPAPLDDFIMTNAPVVEEPYPEVESGDSTQGITSIIVEEHELSNHEEDKSPEVEFSEESSLESSERTFSFSSTSSSVSYVGVVLTACQRGVVESLMKEFGTLFCQDLANSPRRMGSSGGGSSAPSQGSGSNSPPRAGRNNEAMGDRGLPGVPGSGGGSQGPASFDDGQKSILPRKLACPYYKREPWKHTKHRSCAGPGWPAIHRVKEHITRVHALPLYCLRCGDQFPTNDELASHSRSTPACEVKNFDPPEGFTKDQERLLRGKRKAESSDADKWRAVYKILFPDDDDNDMPSPYYDSEEVVELDQYERYLRREVPRVVRRRLERAAALIAAPVENELRAHLVDIIRSSQAEVFEGFRRIIGQPPDRRDTALVPTESIASIIAAPGDQLPTGTEAEQAIGEVDNQIHQYFDFSAFSSPPVVEEAYTIPQTVDPGSAVPGLFRGDRPPAPDSGYGSNSTLQNGRKVMTSLEDWDGGAQMEGSSNWYIPTW